MSDRAQTESSGMGAALIGGLSNILSGVVGGLFSNAQQRKQIQHDKDMAALNNKYQVDQWNRENAYNDPAAVRERYENAGVNPLAAFGTGTASGAGMAGGLSSAPGSASNIMHSGFNFAGLGSDIISGARLQAQIKKDQAEAQLSAEKAASELFERKFIKPHTARLQSALADKGLSEAEIKAIEAQWAPYMADLQSRIAEGNINSQLQSIEESKQRVMQSKAVTSLKEEERKLVAEQIVETAERAKNYAYERAYKAALTALEKVRMFNVEMDTALKEAQKGHYNKLAAHIDKEIEYLGKRMELSDEQIKQWKNIRAQNWTKIGMQAAKWTSEEVRGYMYGWIPGNKKMGSSKNQPNFFDFDDTPMFAD